MTLRELWFRLTYPLRQRRLARELTEEMQTHLTFRAEQLEQRGLSSADAAVAARKRFGNRTRIAAASREAWGWHWLDGAMQDLRYIGRQLRRSPGFALVACLTIALGIALNATAFTFYDAIALKPLPVADPGRVVRVVREPTGFGSEMLPFAAYRLLRTSARTVQSVVTTTGPQSLAAILPGHAREDSRIITARFVSSDFFHALGVRAHAGRWMESDEDRVVVLDYSFWARALNADPSVIGRRIRIGDAELTIVGIAPAQFAGTGMPAMAPDLWMPLAALSAAAPNADWRNDGRSHWQLLGHLAPGVSLSQAAAELTSLGIGIPDSTGKPLSLGVKRATFFQTDAGEFEVFQQVSGAFLVALAFILAIAGVNLVNLFAARNAAREREVTVRLALGGNRRRIARQLASESILLALIGGALGVIAARTMALWLREWLVGTMASISGGTVGVFLDVGVDWRVTVYAALLSLTIGVAVGLWPAFRAARGDLNSVLRQGATSTASAATWGKRNVLLALQIASSLVLLTAAGVLLSAMRRAGAVDPGFDAAHMLVVFVDEEDQTPPERIVRRAEIARRLEALPEARAVGWTRRVPFAGTHLRRARSGTGFVTISLDDVSEHYFDAMALPIVNGRAFTAKEVASNAPVMLISESLARLRWPAGDAIGKSVPVNDILSGPDTTKSYTVLGVVRDVRTNFLSRVNAPATYYPYGFATGFGSFLVRTSGAPSHAMGSVRRALAGISPLLNSRAHVLTMADGPMKLQRLLAEAPASISLVLALTGLALACIGVYGLISQVVTRRTREIGVHMAIGARPIQVVGLVARKTLRPVAWGVLAGGIGAVGLSLLLRALIAMPDVPDLTFGAGAFDPLVFLGVLGVLALVIVAACYLPARRAAAVDPTVALRAE